MGQKVIKHGTKKLPKMEPTSYPKWDQKVTRNGTKKLLKWDQQVTKNFHQKVTEMGPKGNTNRINSDPTSDEIM